MKSTSAGECDFIHVKGQRRPSLWWAQIIKFKPEVDNRLKECQKFTFDFMFRSVIIIIKYTNDILILKETFFFSDSV